MSRSRLELKLYIVVLLFLAASVMLFKCICEKYLRLKKSYEEAVQKNSMLEKQNQDLLNRAAVTHSRDS